MKDGVCSWASYLYDYGRGYQETAIYLVNFIKKNKYSTGQKKNILENLTDCQQLNIYERGHQYYAIVA